MSILSSVKTRRTVDRLREEIPGDWTYNRSRAGWDHPEGHMARWCVIFGGMTGDEVVGRALYLYPATGAPTRVL